MRHADGVILPAVEKPDRLIERLGQLLGVAQQVAPGDKAVLLPSLEFRALQFLDLILQALAQPFFLKLVE